MNPSRSKYPTWLAYALPALVSSVLAGAAAAQQDDLAEGAKLYVSQCKICHGSVTASQSSDAFRAPHAAWRVDLAMQQASDNRTDLPSLGSLELNAASRLAFAPPFGPNLRGVYGRPAGAVTEFQYSKTFMSTLMGMEWNEAALDVWITNPQAWVPGVYMYYKQPDPEVRRKIILYLKANP